MQAVKALAWALVCVHTAPSAWGLQGEMQHGHWSPTTSVPPWALPHRKQKEDVKPLEPLFPQAN